jgi:hypothetical protein
MSKPEQPLYRGFRIAECANYPGIDVFDPRCARPDAPVYRTVSVKYARAWVDSYLAGHAWAVAARLTVVAQVSP